jgi:hypothetical protein
MNPRSLRLIALLPLAVLGAVACGGSAFDSGGQGSGGGGSLAGTGSVTAGSGNVGGSGSAAGSGNVAGFSSAGSTSIGGTGNVGGAGGAAGSGGSAGLDIQACTSNSDCEIEPTSCCSCGSGPVSNFTAINSKYESQYESRCGVVDCAGCPPVAYDPNNPTFYYVATCQASRCLVVDLRTTDITACTTAADCSLRSGTACCPGCGQALVSLNTSREAELSQLVCGDEPIACAECAPGDSGYSTGCTDGRCSVVLGGTCTAANPCPL